MKTRYQCRTDLKKVRECMGLTKEEVAKIVGYSVRSLERMERENATTNKETAMRLAEIYHLNYGEHFYKKDEKLEDVYKEIWAKCEEEFTPADYQKEYYCIYIRKTDLMHDCVFGKGMWVKDCGRDKEVRVLQPIMTEKFMEYQPRVKVINTKEQWMYWYGNLTIGKLYQVVVSEECMRRCLSTCMQETVVRENELFQFDGVGDMMFWGTKKMSKTA